MKPLTRLFALACVAALHVAPARADGPVLASLEARVPMHDREGKDVGHVKLTETPNGLLLRASFTGLPPGEHAFHIHETGACEPTFAAAGGHFAPDDSEHGFLDARGPHAGDLPNLHVPASGRVEVTLFLKRLTLQPAPRGLFDRDRSAFVVHEGPDDYQSEPAGAAGTRIACGVIR